MQRHILLTVTIASVAFASFVGGLHANFRWFTDVPDDHWATKAIGYVVDEGLMIGVSENTFAPDEPVTRAQLAMVLYRQRNDDTYVPPAPDPYVPPTYEPATADDDAVLGKSTAKVTLIEFGDYQCPFCERHFSGTLPQIKKDYIDTGKVKFVFRDFPLSFHQNAYMAAEASECAGEQDEFWAMHDMLYGKQSAWMNKADPLATFVGFAEEIGIDEADFERCIENEDMADEIADDADDASDSGISGTPGFWILGPNGQSQQISGAYPYETFADAFDSMLD